MKKIVVLVSNIGTGTNLQSIIDGVKAGLINAEIKAVVSDIENTPSLKRAKENSLPILICPKKENLLSLLLKKSPDYICLAGWKQIITDDVIDAFPNRIINTHPGLIPDTISSTVKNPDNTKAIWNKGKMTNVAIQNFLDSKATYAGCSNHFLSHEFDSGPVLARVFEKIKKTDTIESLYKRLKVKENKAYVNVLQKLCKEKDLNILVIGQNGREHALAQVYAKSKNVKKVFITPGNGLTDFGTAKIKNYPKVGMLDFNEIVKVCKKEEIDLVDVGQDDIISQGYVDKLQALGIKAFGPTQKASQLEWDKDWARNFMMKYNLPIPKFASFNNTEKAVAYVNSQPEQVLFIKAAGLAFGKGVIRAENKIEAKKAIEQMSKFGKSGETFLIEKCLIGEEFSLFAICDGEDFIVAKTAQDHKTVFDEDKGPNTGGMGSIAPTSVITSKIVHEIEQKILKPVLLGMKKEGRSYKGILYLGGMLTHSAGSGQAQVKIIEFNCRWGDPEAEVILPSIITDYLEIVEAVISKKLKEIKIKFDEKIRISVAGCSRGYPDDYSKVKNKEILGLTQAMRLPGVNIFGSGIKRQGKHFFANGGRVFYIVGEGKDVRQAKERAYKAMALVNISGDNLHYRTDIGWRDLERFKNDN